LAERLGVARDDPAMVMTARSAVSLFELAADTWRAGRHDRDIAMVALDLMRRVQHATIIFPAPPPEIA
jgi:hypothetical protein